MASASDPKPHLSDLYNWRRCNGLIEPKWRRGYQAAADHLTPVIDEKFHDLMVEADRALYLAKGDGRDKPSWAGDQTTPTGMALIKGLSVGTICSCSAVKDSHDAVVVSKETL